MTGLCVRPPTAAGRCRFGLPDRITSWMRFRGKALSTNVRGFSAGGTVFSRVQFAGPAQMVVLTLPVLARRGLRSEVA